jgi:hypothetical protein
MFFENEKASVLGSLCFSVVSAGSPCFSVVVFVGSPCFSVV